MASQVTIRLPDAALALCPDADALGHQMLELWLLDKVRLGQLSAGRAAELLDLPVAQVVDLMHAHGVPFPNYTADDLRREVGLAG